LEAAVAGRDLNRSESGGDLTPPGVAPQWPARLRARLGPAPLTGVLLRQLLDALADGIM
jgi:hypothetical protein